MKLTTYVLNLLKDKERKEYMQYVLSDYPNLDIQYVNAINGKNLSLDEILNQFDNNKAYKRYGRECDLGEIGCSLSHRLAFDLLMNSESNYALILEDDIVIGDGFSSVLEKLLPLIDIDAPCVILLSGGVSYYKKRYYNTLCLGVVYMGDYAHSYLINKAAAKLILDDKKAYIFADDWDYIRNRGVNVLVILPHLVDQRRDGSFVSNVWKDNHHIVKVKLSLIRLCNYILSRIIDKILKRMGNYENKTL